MRNFDATGIRDGRLLIMLAHAQQKLGDHRAALAYMDQARAFGYDDADFHYFRGLQLQFNGRIEEAKSELDRCLALGPTYGRAVLTLARIRKQTPESNHLDYVQKQLTRVERGSEDHAALEFAQFEILEDLGKYAEAFAALERGNAVMYARSRYDMVRDERLLDRLIERTPHDFLRPHNATFEGPNPIFIVGMPRSGTTLLDRILDSHSMVISTGERNDFPRQLRWAADRHGHDIIDEALLDRLGDVDYEELGRRYLAQTQWRARGHRFFIDKLPPNYVLIGLIHRAFPNAPILHISRDPMDVCFSNYKAMFGDTHPYSYAIPALASRYASYRRVMQHWHSALPGRILDVSYRQLVSDPDTTVRNVLAYCRLDFEANCVERRENKTAVDTLSSAQVHEPIHTRSLGEWQRYAEWLEPLRASLAPWLSDAA
jgi:tetratricopeptide (TPR) repeat protein